MTTLQIVLLSVIGGFTLLSIIFMLMFLAEISVGEEVEEDEEVEVKSIFSSENYVNEKDNDVDDMLAKLDEQAKEEVVSTVEAKDSADESETKEEVVETADKDEKIEITNNVNEYNIINVLGQEPETVEESKEEAVATEEESTEEVVETEDSTNEDENNEVVEVENVEVSDSKSEDETSKTEEVEETTEEYIEETTEEVVTTSDSSADDTKTIVIDGTEQISNANLIDYKARLEKIIENKEKLNKDLIKIEKSILNYERTKRRKNRNQKMLDRRASELTNLNLIMYSVTDIKNVDEDKKAKQEELTSHIAELKASIQDAEEFLESNKEKNEHDVKMAKFLIQEKSRYNEEIVELQKLIAKTEGTSVA